MARGRAANGSGTQPRLRPDGRWEIRYTAGIDPATGHPIRKSVYGKTAEEVAKKLREITAAIDAGTWQETKPTRMRLNEWLDIWLNEYTGHLKASTLAEYRQIVRNYIKPGIGGLMLCDIRSPHIQRFVNDLTRGKKALSAGTTKNVFNTLRGALTAACKVGYLKKNPCVGCSLPRAAKNTKTKWLEADEIIAFTEASKGSHCEDLFFVLLNTGMRISECLGLRWSRIDFKNGTITIDGQLTLQRENGQPREIVDTKNGKSRTFKPALAVMERLQVVQRRQKEWRLRAGEIWDNPNGLVFTNEAGEALPYKTVRDRFQAVMKKAGITGRTLHTLRHTCISELCRAGVDPKTVSAMMGHATVRFTLDVYGHVTEAMQDEAAQKMQAQILARG